MESNMIEMLWPNGSTVRPQISSGFGPRDVTQAGASSYHLGCDFIGFDTVHAVADGAVVWVGWRDGWRGGGYMVWVQHSGFLSRSLHLAEGSAMVRIGDRVSKGQALARMGNTAAPNPVGKHLHLEIAPGGGSQVDPVPFITARLSGGRPASAGGSVAPVPASPVPEEEDDMIALRVKDYDGNTHLCTLGLGVFRHLIQEDDPERIKNIVRSDDAWTDTDLVELPRLLKTYGCRGPIWRCEKGVFTVVDSVETQRAGREVLMQGGMWSAVISG